MDKDYYKRRCQAMIKARIANPNSHDGIKFCTERCPYKVCIVFEPDRRRESNYKAQIIAPAASGLLAKEIARQVGCSLSTVRRYLKK